MAQRQRYLKKISDDSPFIRSLLENQEYESVDPNAVYKEEGSFVFDTLMHNNVISDLRVFVKKSSDDVYGLWDVCSQSLSPDGSVHNGLIATMFDSTFGILFFAAAGFGFTANISIDYLVPMEPNQCVIVHEVVASHERRKYSLAGTVTNADGTVVYAEAKSLFISADIEAVKEKMKSVAPEEGEREE